MERFCDGGGRRWVGVTGGNDTGEEGVGNNGPLTNITKEFKRFVQLFYAKYAKEKDAVLFYRFSSPVWIFSLQCVVGFPLNRPCSVECIDSLAGMRRFRTDRCGDYDCRGGACEFQRERIGEMDGGKTDPVESYNRILNCQFVILRDLEREQLVKVATARRRMVSRGGGGERCDRHWDIDLTGARAPKMHCAYTTKQFCTRWSGASASI